MSQITLAIFASAIFPAVIVNADVAAGGEAFPLFFEGPPLSDALRAAIEADISAFWSMRTNAVVELGDDGTGVKGRIFDGAICYAPYFADRVEVPKWLVTSGTNLTLRIPASFSSAFASSLTLCASHTNELAALSTFLASLEPSALATASAEELSRMILRNRQDVPISAAKAENLRRDLSSFVYGRPSPLGIGEANGVSESPSIQLVAAVPVYSRDSSPMDYGVMRVGWNGTHWQILSFF